VFDQAFRSFLLEHGDRVVLRQHGDETRRDEACRKSFEFDFRKEGLIEKGTKRGEMGRFTPARNLTGASRGPLRSTILFFQNFPPRFRCGAPWTTQEKGRGNGSRSKTLVPMFYGDSLANLDLSTKRSRMPTSAREAVVSDPTFPLKGLLWCTRPSTRTRLPRTVVL